ncbi:MAG: RNA polymerase factor sigma-54 [Brachymonas sp.]
MTGLKLKATQSLTLTPQLQQAIKLLALSNLELEQEVERMLEDNPFLEREEPELSAEDEAQLARHQAELYAAQSDNNNSESNDASSESSDSDLAGQVDDWGGDGTVDASISEGEWGEDAPSSLTPGSGAADPDFDPLSICSAASNLYAHLHQQALGQRLTDSTRAALYFLIESLNEEGYLEDSLVHLAQHLVADSADDDFEQLEDILAEFKIALRLLQNMEPVGVGARDLPECLKLQILQWPDDAVRTLALEICSHQLDLLAKKDPKALAKACAAPESVVRLAMQGIARLEPKPGRRFVQTGRNIIVPDVIVKAKGQGRQKIFMVQLNRETMPRLRVDRYYAQALKNAPAGAAQQSLQEARSFVKNVQQRFDTILRTAEVIVRHQHEFLLRGALAMKPLVLKAVADELGMHESTISRVTTAKYLATPQGTFEMKYFFSSSLGSNQGEGDASSTAVRAHIQRMVDAEDKRKPISDGKLADALAGLGIDCARRTVAKYREQLRIPAVSERRLR